MENSDSECDKDDTVHPEPWVARGGAGSNRVSQFLAQGWMAEGRPPLTVGYINLLAVALLVPMGTLSAPWGAQLAHRLNRVWLSRDFAFFLLATSARMILSIGR